MMPKFIRLILLIVSVTSVTVSCKKTIEEPNYSNLANTLLGTKGKGFGEAQRYLEAGYTFPGPMRPFGMVQFTTTFFDPDKGFVINQMSGAGCHNMGNLPMLPVPGELNTSPNDMMGFSPEIQIQEAHAGYFDANLFKQINCQLTVTEHTGLARIIFNEAEKGTIVIGTGINSTEISEANVKITGPNSFEGVADGGNFCGANSKYNIYFVGEFSKPASTFGSWKKDVLQESKNETEGSNSGVYFTFDKGDEPVLYKVGISYVSLDNAKLNLETENPGWDFEKIRRQAEKEWNNLLGLIEVDGASEDKIIQFYSHLYHCFAHPSVFNDVNGEYIGADFTVHTIEDGNYYTAYSNWDTYRTQIQLLSMLVPEKASEMVSSLLTFAEQSGGGLPRWVCANFETGIMQGDPSAALICNAYAFGAKSFDTSKAMEIMRLGAEVPGTASQGIETREQLDQYLDRGYIWDLMGASKLLEYTSADFAIAQFARQAFQDEALYDAYLKRSQKWKNIFNPETNWLQSRNEDGSWKPQTEDWREASYKNYFWMVPYDLKTLTDTIGGAEVAEKRLDEFFTKLNANYHEEFFAAGNEPSFQSPWSYNWIGNPAKTQETVRRIINEQYSNNANGLPGNEDMGAMGAWYIFANLGLYPMAPGVDGFSVNGPSYERIKIHLGSGNELLIEGGSEQNKYTDGLEVNGKTWNSTWLPLKEIENGGKLQFRMSSTTSVWGATETPPSFNEL
nr:GH92 family glycosyl hydrolase [uncultured Draconibacterium sp.]